MTPLAQILRDEIGRSGPISFHRFMEAALYHPEFGYYRRPGRVGLQQHQREALEPDRGNDERDRPAELIEHLGAADRAEVLDVPGSRRPLDVTQQRARSRDPDQARFDRARAQQRGDALLDRQPAELEEPHARRTTDARIRLMEVRDHPDPIGRQAAIDHDLPLEGCQGHEPIDRSERARDAMDGD